jgi:hypothetical protein
MPLMRSSWVRRACASAANGVADFVSPSAATGWRGVALSGDQALARQLHKDNLALSRRMHFDWCEAASLQELVTICLAQRDLTAARALHQQSIALLHAGSYGYSLTYTLDLFATFHAVKSK